VKLSELDELYRVAEGFEVVRHEVGAGLFADFSQAVNRAVIEAGDIVDDDVAWASLLRYLKRLRFVLSSTPLWLAHPSRHVCVGRLPDREVLVREAELTRPTAIDPLREAFAYADLMHGEGSSELRSAAGEIAEQEPSGSLAFLVKGPRYVECARLSLLQELKHRGVHRPFEVLVPSQLRTTRPVDALIVFGPTSWYPAHLLGTPRARRLHILKHEWIEDREPVRLRFEGGGVRESAPRRTERVRRHTEDSADRRIVQVEGSDLLPSIDMHRLRSMSAVDRPGDGATVEQARVFVLEGGKGVFLAADEGSAKFTIDVEELQVRRTPVARIEEGAFLVLRTEGGGDYVRTLADTILGCRAAVLRAAQEAWKRPLRELISRSESLRAAALSLEQRGVPSATPGNVARWASAENICTQHQVTFQALSEALGVRAESGAVWDQMVEIRGAHLRAAGVIKGRLHERVAAADLTQLRANGVMEFTLEDLHAGTLTAYRVNQVGTEFWDVEAGQLGRPFDLES
jgi:hypothetical protein